MAESSHTEYTYEELRAMTVAQLRDVAAQVPHDAVRGYTQMNKERLLPALCRALGINMQEHHDVVGAFDKAGVKAKLRMLKMELQQAHAAHDDEKARELREQRRRLNHQVRVHVR